MLETDASFADPIEAQIVCALLESGGIEATTADLNVVTANRLWAHAIGGVRVQVTEGDLAAARASRPQVQGLRRAAGRGVTAARRR
jgi:hypothetical protein